MSDATRANIPSEEGDKATWPARVVFGIPRLGARLTILLIELLTLLLLFLQSDPGRDALLSILVTQVNARIAGQLEVGALEGDLVSELTLREIELTGPDGRSAARRPHLPCGEVARGQGGR